MCYNDYWEVFLIMNNLNELISSAHAKWRHVNTNISVRNKTGEGGPARNDLILSSQQWYAKNVSGGCQACACE